MSDTTIPVTVTFPVLTTVNVYPINSPGVV